MSTLKVDTIQTTAGAAQEFGKVLQIVDNYNTDFSTTTGSSNSYTNVANMGTTITPSSTSSKVLILVHWTGELSVQHATYNGMWGLKRGTTVIGQPTISGSTPAGEIGIAPAVLSYWGDDVASTMESLHFHYLDSPSTTSATTYNLWFSSGSYNITIKSGGSYSWNTSRINQYERGTYGMTLMEIG